MDSELAQYTFIISKNIFKIASFTSANELQGLPP